MAAAFITIGGATIVAETVAMALSPLLSVTSNLYNGLKLISNISKNDITLSKVLRDTDIVYDIEVVSQFLCEYKYDNCGTAAAAENLKEVIEELNEVVKTITEKVARHKRKWFHRYRAYNIAKERDELVILSTKLHHRLDILTKLSLIRSAHNP